MNNYKLLPALNALLQTQSLTEAAKLLHVTQPAMSRTLGQIRDAFGDPMLVRDGKEFVLTNRARELKQTIPSLLRDMDALYQRSDFELEEIQRRFHIAFDSFISATALPEIAKLLSSTCPNASIQGSILDDGQLEAIATSSLDLVATMAVDVPNHIHGKRIASDHYVVLGAGLHWHGRSEISLQEYFTAKHIQVSGLSDKTREVDGVFKKREHQRRIAAVMPNLDSAAQLLAETSYLMTVPSHIADALCCQHSLKTLPLPFELPEHHYYLLWHERHHKDPEHRWFRQECYRLIKQRFQP
ncbi:LysR family transcriptional regulator [Vibrio bivalvicida]|uniref:LysR family transcriptional regulator n=1 Tax=Vibrio bivalvicida TaxID=1276888 RepID=A0A177Y031_9VIBR|nr:LysR family transcriptional regulator [Vibrio bivalvicida]OAJ94214.1 LysR family transcriptional regulator [Vibrio bivalvicida]